MTAVPTPSTTQGRIIRAALVILPAGTIFFGIISFGIWHWKKQRVEERSYKFASAMRRDINEAAIARYVTTLREVLQQPDPARRLPAVSSFLESSMGAENMGYHVRREFFQSGEIELATVEAELTGKKRPREIVLLLASYGLPGKHDADSHDLATLMSVAHAVAGENREVTLRFAAAPPGVKDLDGHTAIERLAAASRDREERIMKIFLLGSPDAAMVEHVRTAVRAEAQGTVVQALNAPTDTAATVQFATALKETLMAEIDK